MYKYRQKCRAIFALLCLSLCGIVLFVGCGTIHNLPPNFSNGNPPNTVENYSGENDIIADFSTGLSSLFYCANDYCNGGVFDTYWSKNNITHNLTDGTLHFSLTQNSKYAASGAEYRSYERYGFGYFAVKMQAIKKSGTVSSFFVYTGPAEGTKWDEIDIEFLGKDTTKVQFNYFSDGKGGHEYLYNLGFDASLELHEYGFLWQETSITWFVDGVAVYSAYKDIPNTAARIMANVWVGKTNGTNSVVGWLGQFDNKFPIDDAKYQWISYKALKYWEEKI